MQWIFTSENTNLVCHYNFTEGMGGDKIYKGNNSKAPAVAGEDIKLKEKDGEVSIFMLLAVLVPLDWVQMH